jgi:DNA-binding transcriptional LysR family regulator
MDRTAMVRGSERWSSLEIRLLIAFVAVVDAGSFTGAARELGYTQSGISQQIAALERIVEHKLLVRQSGGRRPIELTPVGDALLRHSRIILGQLDRAYADVVGNRAALAATVGVASFPSAAVHLVPEIERVLRAESSLQIDLHESVADEDVLADLVSRKAELAFAMLPVPAHFAAEALGSDPYVAVVSASSPFASLNEVSLDQLAGHALLGVRSSTHENAVEARLSAAGLDCRDIRRYDDDRLIQALVRADSGVAIVPSTTIAATDRAVRMLKIHAELPPRVIALVQLRDTLLSPAAREFKQLAVPVCRRILAATPYRWEQAAAS